MQCSCYSVTDGSWTRSQIKPFPLQLPLSELFYHSNGKWTKIQGLWGSSLSPLYGWAIFTVPTISMNGYQKLARPRRWTRDEDFPQSPPAPHVLSTAPILLCWGCFSEEKVKKEQKHSWFLVTHRGTHSALASFCPFLVPPLTRRVSLWSSIFSSKSFLCSGTVRSADTE